MEVYEIKKTNLWLVVRANKDNPNAMKKILASEEVKKIFPNLSFDKQRDLFKLLTPSEQANLFELLTPEGQAILFRLLIPEVQANLFELLTPKGQADFLEQFKLTDEPAGKQKRNN